MIYRRKLLFASGTAAFRHFWLNSSVENPSSYKGGAAATVDGAAAELTTEDGRFKLDIPDISAHRLGKTFTVKLVTGGQTTTVKVSALSYAYAILNTSKDPLAVNAVIALYKYYKAAAAYKA